MAEGSHETPILWDDACVPSAEDDEFQNVINCGGKSNFRPGPDQCRRWDKAPNSSTHASFGDDGTTATVNAYGDIVQFGTFIDRGHSGMFSADHGFVAEPYLVDGRTRDLFELSTLNLSSQPEIYGLVIGWRFGDQPQLQWVNYRWPRYEFKDKGKSETTIQCMVHDGVVIQHYTLTNQEDKDAEVTCEFQGPDDEKMQIRDLDHVDPNYRFNERYKDYTATHGPHGYSWILTHKLETSKANGMPIPGSPKVKPSLENQAPMTSQAESVAVVVSVFINGKAVEWGDSEQWKLTIAGTKTNTTNNPDAANVAEVVIAYKMILAPVSKGHWEDFLIPAAYTNIRELINKEPRPNLPLVKLPYSTKRHGQQAHDEGSETGSSDQRLAGEFENNDTKEKDSRRNSVTDEHTMPADPTGIPENSSPASHISFVVHRNIEHILSVCSIPLKPARMRIDAQVTDEEIPVALTCGDLSFHRINVSSSFFAFQYLLDIARRLRHPHLLENDYAQWLLSRISSVCKGHLQWISEKAELSDAGIFVANYWVTGRIMGQQSPSWRPPNALTDTPFQIVKAGDYAEVFPEDEARAKAAVQRVYLAWLRGMAQANKRNSFAWPHAGESDVNVFRLDDHLWIWKALETIHKLDLWTTSDQPRVKLGVSLPEDIPKTPEGEDSLKILAKIYGYRNVQREMLRRFTTQSDISRKRMLAVTRSSRETRFLFHARDTVLFYEYGGFLLQETSFRQVWENTIEAQQHHDENQETRWDNALRYALAIVMGADGYSINNEKTPAQLVEASLHVLLKSSSPNGLFAGQLDEATKEPVMFYREDDRDFYFHASFEIPFILLTRATRINKEMEIAPPNKREGDLQENMRHDNIAEFSERLTTQPKRQLMVSELESPVLAQKENIPGIQGGVITKIVQGTQQSQTMKKTMPFNRFVDSSSIVEIDEEWLYNYPAFLSETKALSFQQVREQLERYLIESWDTPSTADLFEQDVELAAGIVASDEELRNNLCRDIAGGNLSICLDILQDSNNRWMRDKLSESLRSEISPVVREFLNNGELRIQDNIPSKPGATNVASFAASVDRPPPDSLMQIAEFLKEDDVSETFEMILREDKSTLMRILKTNNETRKVLQGHLDTDTVIRILRNKTFYEKIAKLFEGKDVAPQPVVLKAATKYLDEIHNRTDGQTEDTWPFQDSAITAIVGDTMKKRTQGKRSKNYADSSLAWQTDLKLWEHYLNKPRTAESAKKRFVGLPAAATINTALICFLGSPDREKLPISLFFDRHRNCELFFFDDTTMSLNTWVTELHLSFYQLVNHDSTLDPGGIPETQRYPLPGSKGNQIIKASVGFRFIGDFFDRYWTCHFVEHLPVDQPSTDWELTKFDSRDRSWRQRKVFELVLVDRILLLLVYSTKQIVEEIKLELGVEPGAFSLVNLRSDNYFSSSEQWQASQQSLQALEDHLELVIANVVGKWETREEDRGTERPRWTHNDEWKYRGDLKKLLASNNSKIRDMRSLHNEIRTLKEFLMSRQDQIRNDLSLRGAENIRLFTYVTVVFLPVGFAASIFSMSGIPDGQLVSPMASTAAVALVLTVFALVNAETLGIIAETISRTIAHYSNVRMNSSYLLRQYKMARQDKEESVDDHNETSRGSIVPKVSSPTSPPSTSHHSATIDVRENGRTQDRNKWHAWFWVVYLVIDLPASRAVLAYSAMKVHKLSIIAVFNVVLGVLVLPWCIIIWMFHLIILNLVDLFRVMKHFIHNPFSGLFASPDPLGGNRILLLQRNTVIRPFSKIELRSREKKAEKTNQEEAAKPEKETSSSISGTV